MTNIGQDHARLLADARERGSKAFGAAPLPPGLDHVTAYVGLISSALELGKLIATEERDLKVIGSHHEIEIAKIEGAFKEVEAAMIADFKRDHSLREKSFESINLLIAAGQHELALKFYERLMDGFTKGALEGLIQLRNNAASESTTRMKLK
jgi:hypothetical protein